MNPRHTWLWIFLAGGLFLFIFFIERHVQKPPAIPERVLPGLHADAVTGIRIVPENGAQIRAVRSNGVWSLEPYAWTAQKTNVDNLLTALEKLAPSTYLSLKELKELQAHGDPDEQFGFASPQASVTVQPGSMPPSTILVGATTAPGDKVYVEVVGQDGMFVVDSTLTNLIPRSINQWRDRSFADLSQLKFDSVQVTNAAGVFELRQNLSNQLWYVALPDHYRADLKKIVEALVQIHKLQAMDFVSDKPAGELDGFGLQPPALEISFSQGTNTVLRLQFGSSPTNNAAAVYARRADQPGVVLVSRDALAPWRGSYAAFRDRHLINITESVDRIESLAPGDNYTIQREGSNTWRILPQNYPADPVFVQQMIQDLTTNQAVEFAQDVVTDPLLPRYGLAKPARTIILETAHTNSDGTVTNLPMAHLDFGVADGKVYAHPADEPTVYGVDPSTYSLPSSLQMREHRVADFSENDVAKVISRQGADQCSLVRRGTNSWTFGPPSQGTLNDFDQRALDILMYRLGGLTASLWVAHGAEHLAEYGFSTNSFQVSIELNDGKKWDVEFSGIAPSGYQYAATTLDGVPWIFEFPPSVYGDVRQFLWDVCKLH